MRLKMFRFASEENRRINERRQNRAHDLVERKGVITAERIHLKGYPIDRPVAIFNASLAIEGEEATLYGRIVLGYYTYASAVAEFKIPLADIKKDYLSKEHFTAEIVVLPNSRFDLWGVEDPRVYEVDGRRLMTYCGRTINYFNPSIRINRTLPVMAVREDGGWRKICAFRLPKEFKGQLISDKDAILMRTRKGLILLHRPHMADERFYLTTSRVPERVFKLSELSEVRIRDTTLVIEPAKFEQRAGWGTPPIRVGREYLMLLHGVGRVAGCYRIFAVLMNDRAEVTAVTPYYIMEPKENYEIYGDRPFTIFPCGAEVVDDELLVSYGAADSSVGIGSIDLTKLMSILDSNRLS